MSYVGHVRKAVLVCALLAVLAVVVLASVVASAMLALTAGVLSLVRRAARAPRRASQADAGRVIEGDYFVVQESTISGP